MRFSVKKLSRLNLILPMALVAFTAYAQQPKPASTSMPPTASSASPSQAQKNIESYLRNLYAFGPDVKLIVGPLKESPVEGLVETNIDVTIGENKEAAKFYVSKDGRFLFRGEMSDMTKDPLAENLAQIRMTDAPALGDAKAPVTVVEYSDFECPVCRNLHDALRGLLPNYAGKVRVVFKDYPLEHLHPWARTPAIAGRCAYRQEPKAFWQRYDVIYDKHGMLSARKTSTQ